MLFRHITTRFSGLIILIAGVWGGLIPFLGPVFHFALGPDHAWKWTTGRLWLDVLPAAAAVLGGLILMGGGPRISGRFGALLALAGGVWFAVGPDVSMLWNHGVSQAGAAHGHHTITRMLEFLTLHSGIGVLITALAAYSLPGLLMYRAARGVVGTGAALGAAAAGRRRGRDDADEDRDEAATREREPAAAAAAPAAGAGAGAGAAGAGAGAAPVGAPGAIGGHPADPTSPRPVVPGAGAGAAGAGTAGAGAAGTGAAGDAAEGTAAQPATDAPATQRRGGLLSGLFGRR